MSASPKIYNQIQGQISTINYAGPAAGNETTVALNSAYTYATAGAAFFTVFANQESANLTDFWVKVNSYSGTWASTDGVINVQIREGLNGSNIPGTSLTGSFTITLDGSTTGWIKTTLGSPIALTAGKMYSIVIADADGGATNFVTLVGRTSSGTAPAPLIGSNIVTTTNGYSTAGSATTGGADIVFKVGSVLYGGNGFNTIATITTGTYERGMRFKPTDNCTVVGFIVGIDNQIMTAGHTVNLYADGTAPGGTKLLSYTCPTTTLGAGSSPFPSFIPFPSASWVDLTGGTWYRFVFKPVSNLTTPRKMTIGGTSDADVINTFMPFGAAHWIQDTAGSWDDSQTTSLSAFSPVLVPNTTAGAATGESAYSFG